MRTFIRTLAGGGAEVDTAIFICNDFPVRLDSPAYKAEQALLKQLTSAEFAAIDHHGDLPVFCPTDGAILPA
ncbi:MAG: hypothetical protein H7144_18505 [Burkholderiales bacterium]|nr:hypothetical protein [Phycisphaerae bacterium]